MGGSTIDKNAVPNPEQQSQQVAMGTYKAASGEDAASSKANTDAQTQANRPDQTNAYGSQTQWTQNPDGTWTQSQGFGGALGGAANALQSQWMQNAGKGFNDGSAARDQAIKAAYGQATSRLDPQWAQNESALKTRLVNQGLDPTSEAYKSEMSNFGQQKNDAYSSAMNSAIGQGTAAGSALFNQNMASYQMPLQQLLAMSGLLGNPGFNAAGRSDPTQNLAAVNAAGNLSLGDRDINQKKDASMIDGFTSFAGSAVGAASDERVKTDINRLDEEAAPGVPFATFKYKGRPGRYKGVIAQDLEKVSPESVHEGPGGLKMVDPEFAPFSLRQKKKR